MFVIIIIIFIFFSSKECQIRHWQCHKSACHKLRKVDHVELTKANCFKVSSKSSLSDVPFLKCAGNESVTLKSSLEDDGCKCKEFNRQDELTGHSYSITSASTISNCFVCKVQKEEDGEGTFECSQQQDDTMNQVHQTPLKELDICKSENTFIGKSVTIIIKHNKVRQELSVPSTENGDAILQMISHCVGIPVSKLKLIHKGKMVTRDNIQSMLFNKALFLAFGEISESEEGLEKEDIDLIVKQLGVERNLAVKVLRKNCNVVDAIIEIGNM